MIPVILFLCSPSTNSSFWGGEEQVYTISDMLDFRRPLFKEKKDMEIIYIISNFFL